MEEEKMGSSAEETALDSGEPHPTTKTARGSSAAQEQIDSPRNRPNPSSEAFDGSQNIVDATKACRDSFARCPAIEGLGINWAEDRLADFKLWDASVGASSNKNTSLDKRLDSKPHIRNVVVDLLTVLKSTIDQCRVLGENLDLYMDTSVVQERSPQAGSVQENSCPTSFETGLEPQFRTLLATVETVDTLLNDLVQLAVMIRKATVNSHISKADKRFVSDDPDLRALRDHLTHIVQARAESLEIMRDSIWEAINGGRAEHPNNVDIYLLGFPLIFPLLDPIQDRLIVANLRRNHRFLYSQRHELKRERAQLPSVHDITPSTDHDHEERSTSVRSKTFSQSHHLTTDVNIAIEPVGYAGKTTAVTVLSNTTGSVLEPNMMKQSLSSVSTSQRSGTLHSAPATRIRARYPRPPFSGGRSLELKCPCCCVPLSKKDLKGTRWRKHIDKDLQPYTCVLDPCDDPYTFFSEKEKWIQHMTDDHSHSEFYHECPLCEDEIHFDTGHLLENHLRDGHPDAITNIPAFLQVCSKPRILGDMGCPLCSVERSHDDVSGMQLLNHVAEHIHSFSFSSLPLMNGEEEHGEKPGYYKTNPYFAADDGDSLDASEGDSIEGRSTLARVVEAGSDIASKETEASALLHKDIETSGNALTSSALEVLKEMETSQLGHQQINEWSLEVSHQQINEGDLLVSHHNTKRTQASSKLEAPLEKRKRVSFSPVSRQKSEEIYLELGEPAYLSATTLCSRCLSIDIEKLFFDLGETYNGIRLMNLGNLGAEAALSSCSLCRLFYASRIQDDDDYALYLTNPPPPNNYWDGPVLAVARDAGSDIEGEEWVENTHRIGASRGFIARSEASEMASHARSLRVRSIDAKSIDFETIRRWMYICTAGHKECNVARSPASLPTKMRLVDCELRKVVLASPSDKYSALSYVWVREKSANDDRYFDNVLPASLPRTIEDALQVTQILGFRYIWIDRYCIDLEDVEIRHCQTQEMDLVYENAAVTIVAAAGTDSYSGLPGVSNISRTPQATARIGNQFLVSTLSDPQTLIKASEWMKRAWTYQESVLSSRILVFTEQQVYYECRASIAFETVDNFLNSGDYQMFDKVTSDQHCANEIFTHLIKYSGRNLSYASDALHAFSGVFRSFRRHNLPVHQYKGVPIGPLAGFQDQTNRSKSEAFAVGLSWYNTAPGTRRDMFPSWSWAGWAVTINFETGLRQRGLDLRNEHPLKVFVENFDGSIADMDEQSDVSLDHGIPGSSNIIHIESWTIPIVVQFMPDRAGDWFNKIPSQNESLRNISDYFAVFQSDEETVQVPIYLLGQDQTYTDGFAILSSIAPDLEKESLLGIVLGKCEDLSQFRDTDTIFVMIVQKNEHYHQRIGHMLLNGFTMRSLRNNDVFASPKIPWQLCFRLKERMTIRLS